eukprot:13224626-Alexandrium_andersonii.AAC.1
MLIPSRRERGREQVGSLGGPGPRPRRLYSGPRATFDLARRAGRLYSCQGQCFTAGFLGYAAR